MFGSSLPPVVCRRSHAMLVYYSGVQHILCCLFLRLVCPMLPISLDCPFLAHLAFRPCELLSSLFVRRPSVNISHFNLLLRNHWTNCNQTLVKWSLDGPLSKLCPVIPTSNQDGRQAKNRKKGG